MNMPKDNDQHKCDAMKKIRSLNTIIIQFEASWTPKAEGGWTLNLDGGGLSRASEWIDFCPFCGVKLEK